MTPSHSDHLTQLARLRAQQVFEGQVAGDYGVAFAEGIVEANGSLQVAVACAIVSNQGSSACVQYSVGPLPPYLAKRVDGQEVTERDLEEYLLNLDPPPYDTLVEHALMAFKAQTE